MGDLLKRTVEKTYGVKADKYNQCPQGKCFEDTIISNFNDCCKFIEYLALRFIGIIKLMNRGRDGILILDVANLSFGEINFH